MTDPQDPDSVESPSNSAGESTDAVSDITRSTPKPKRSSRCAGVVAARGNARRRAPATHGGPRCRAEPYAAGAAGAASATPHQCHLTAHAA